jgi:hypothetical protein
LRSDAAINAGDSSTRRHHLKRVAALKIVAPSAQHANGGSNRGIGVGADVAFDLLTIMGEYYDQRRVIFDMRWHDVTLHTNADVAKTLLHIDGAAEAQSSIS